MEPTQNNSLAPFVAFSRHVFYLLTGRQFPFGFAHYEQKFKHIAFEKGYYIL